MILVEAGSGDYLICIWPFVNADNLSIICQFWHYLQVTSVIIGVVLIFVCP